MLYIVIETDRDNDCNADAFSEALGPYHTMADAKRRADELTARGHWAMRYRVVGLALNHWSDDFTATGSKED